MYVQPLSYDYNHSNARNEENHTIQPSSDAKTAYSFWTTKTVPRLFRIQNIDVDKEIAKHIVTPSGTYAHKNQNRSIPGTTAI